MAAMDDVFRDVDAIIGSSTKGSLLAITNFSGHPSLTLRAGFVERPLREEGPLSGGPAVERPDHGPAHTMPHAITLWGHLFDEGTQCAIGMALEAEFGVADRRPPVG